MKDSHGSPPAGGTATEFAFEPVPDAHRKKLVSLTSVLSGYPIALSNFVIGGAVGVNLTLADTLRALLIGNAILIFVVVATGIIAYRNGLPTAFLSRKVFGAGGSSIFSFLIGLSAITWISLNGDIFARLTAATFSWWPLPVPVTAVLIVFLWLQSAIRGFRGLTVLAYVGVPAAVLMSLWGLFAVWQQAGFEQIANFTPKAPMSMTAATASVVGGWIYGATITPDVCRFARCERDVYIAGIVAFVLGCFGLQLIGAVVAQATGFGNFIDAMLALKLVAVAFITAGFCLWTTEGNDIYGASLAFQNLLRETPLAGKLTHGRIATAVSVIAALLAAGGIYNFILPAIIFFSVLVPPVPGMLIAEEFFLKKSFSGARMNPVAIGCWLAGGLASYLCLRFNFFIPPLAGMVTAGVLYAFLCRNAAPQPGRR